MSPCCLQNYDQTKQLLMKFLSFSDELYCKSICFRIVRLILNLITRLNCMPSIARFFSQSQFFWYSSKTILLCFEAKIPAIIGIIVVIICSCGYHNGIPSSCADTFGGIRWFIVANRALAVIEGPPIVRIAPWRHLLLLLFLLNWRVDHRRYRLTDRKLAIGGRS